MQGSAIHFGGVCKLAQSHGAPHAPPAPSATPALVRDRRSREPLPLMQLQMLCDPMQLPHNLVEFLRRECRSQMLTRGRSRTRDVGTQLLQRRRGIRTSQLNWSISSARTSNSRTVPRRLVTLVSCPLSFATCRDPAPGAARVRAVVVRPHGHDAPLRYRPRGCVGPLR